MTPGEWTAARVALMQAEYEAAGDNRAMLEKVNALPGAPILSVKSLTLKAKRLGLRKTAEALAALNARRIEAVRQSNAGRPRGTKDSGPRKPRAPILAHRRGAPPSFRPGVAVAVPLVVEQPSEDPGIRRYQRARALIAQGKDPFRVAADVGIEPWRALGIVGEIRQERAR